MSILASDIITTRAPAIWGTALTSQLTTDARPTTEWLSDALIALYSSKPQARMSPTTGESVDFAEITALTDSIDIDRKWMLCLTHYVAAMGFYADGENADHRARAQEHMNLFTTFLGL